MDKPQDTPALINGVPITELCDKCRPAFERLAIDKPATAEVTLCPACADRIAGAIGPGAENRASASMLASMLGRALGRAIKSPTGRRSLQITNRPVRPALGSWHLVAVSEVPATQGSGTEWKIDLSLSAPVDRDQLSAALETYPEVLAVLRGWVSVQASRDLDDMERAAQREHLAAQTRGLLSDIDAGMWSGAV